MPHMLFLWFDQQLVNQLSILMGAGGYEGGEGGADVDEAVQTVEEGCVVEGGGIG